ncbi:MAG TPA: DCC1-like thiol-disulfide oxidoreductase family protein [Holophagaceae bacterium]|nr:DCC1-like thiol-disulfide oxidoreductase family protein [Holophagaceae bacterium]
MDLIFYDGECGLCHGAVAFLARRDRGGERFRFAPLRGTTFRQRVPDGLAAALPDSLALQTPEGRLLIRSRAVIHALKQLGGFWGALGAFLGWFPRPLADGAYNGVARIRRSLFKKPDSACPALPRDLRDRFLT